MGGARAEHASVLHPAPIASGARRGATAPARFRGRSRVGVRPPRARRARCAPSHACAGGALVPPTFSPRIRAPSPNLVHLRLGARAVPSAAGARACARPPTMPRPYSEDLRERIARSSVELGRSAREIAEAFSVSRRAVYSYARMWRERGTVQAAGTSMVGRHRKLSPAHTTVRARPRPWAHRASWLTSTAARACASAGASVAVLSVAARPALGLVPGGAARGHGGVCWLCRL